MNAEGFLARCAIAGECVEWQAYIASNGYGKTGRHWVHRLAYELFVGPIPEGLVIDHLCRNRRCVNPSHLEPVTNGENLRRGEGFAGLRCRQVACARGHVFTPETTLIRRGGNRQCRVCDRERALSRYHRRTDAQRGA